MYSTKRQSIKNRFSAHIFDFPPFRNQTLGPQKAAELDKELMSEEGGFSIDQLMELAGLSVSQAGELGWTHPRGYNAETWLVYKVHPPSQGRNILVAAGPGNNGAW